MKRSVNLTHAWLDAKKVDSREVWYDSGCLFLTVRIGTGERPSKVFYWFGRDETGQPKRVKIGAYPAMTVPKARGIAKQLTGDVASGESPVARLSRRETTFGQLFEWYIENHAKPHKKTWHEDQRNYEKRMSQWEKWKLSKITKPVVRKLHIDIRKDNPGGPYAANKMLELLGFMWRLGRDEFGYDSPDPTKGIKRFDRIERERFLDQGELPLFLEAVNSLQNETTRDLILLALLTGARRSNICGMRWADIDWKSKTWTVPRVDAKGRKKSLRIVLSAEAVEILTRRKKASKTQWVLPGKGRNGHMTEPKHAIAKIMADSGLRDVRFHDLRRTLGSWQAAQGTSMIVIGKTLGHNPGSTATRVYARLDLDPVREAVSSATASMMQSKKKSR